jgi:serine/threonine protein kinase
MRLSSAAGELASVKPVVAGEERFGAYVLLDRIGKGGMAEVHRARLERGSEFRKTVALKRVLPHLASEGDFRERFLQEARTVAELQHPNVVQVFDFGEIDDRPYIIMELVDGIDLWRLAGLVQRSGHALDMWTSLYIVSEAARGLGYAHAHKRDGRSVGIVHRDVSPQNILLSRLGEVKVADFGIAKATGDVFDHPNTTSGALVGKLRYMSPEQITARAVDGRTDVFGLGVVLHELLTGSQLVNAVSPAGIIEQVREAAFEVPSHRNPAVSPALDAIVMKALARNPTERYQRAEDLSRALTNLLMELKPGYGRDALGELVGKYTTELENMKAAGLAAVPAAPVTEISAIEVNSDLIVDEPSQESSPEENRDGSRTSRARGKVIPLHTSDFLSLVSQVVPKGSPSQGYPAVEGPATQANPVVELPPSEPIVRMRNTESNPRVKARPNGRGEHAAILVGLACVGVIAFALLRAYSERDSAVAPPAEPVLSAPLASTPTPAPVVTSLPVVPAPVAATPAKPIAAEPARVAPRRKAVHLLDGEPVITTEEGAAPAGQEAAVANARAAYKQAQRSLIGDHVVDAEKQFERSLSLYPGYAPSYRGLASAYARRGESQLAADSLRTYLRNVPGAPDSALLRRQLARLEHGDTLIENTP